MLSFKPGIRLNNLQPQIILGLLAVHSIYEEYGYELVITSVSEGKHKIGSLHYSGCAVDLRINNIAKHDLSSIISSIKNALGSNFDVVWEVTHLHVEYDPKY